MCYFYFCQVKNWRHLLWPFGLIYLGITSIRNFFFDKGILSEREFDLPVIVIGNLSTGGTGKTPHTEWVVCLLKSKFELATLSRGYGRKTKGYLEVHETDSAEHVGDEPLQFKKKFSDIFVSVCEKRVDGILKILGKKQNTEVIVLDDAYQHRYVKPGFKILLTTYQQPFFNDYILPVGNLRESQGGKKRANAIIVTKCPDELGKDQIDKYKACIHHSQTDVFFTRFAYKTPIPLFSSQEVSTTLHEIIVITGIAKPEVFIKAMIKSGKTVLSHLQFADHHNFSQTDIDKITFEWENCESKTAIFTTEKDAMRLMPFKSALSHIPIFYVPIEIEFIDNRQNVLENSIVSYVTTNQKDC